MQRYKIKHEDERNYLKVSFLPREIELIWTIILGIWFTVILSKEILCIGENCLLYIQNLVLIVFMTAIYFALISIAFARGFKEGNLNAYGFILWISILISFRLINYYINSFDINQIKILWNLNLQMRIVSFLILFPLVSGILINLIYSGISRKAKPIVLIVIPTGCLFIILTLIIIYFGRIIQLPRILEIGDVFKKSGINCKDVCFQIIMITAINVLVMVRIIVYEAFYMFNKIKFKIPNINFNN